MVVQCLLHAANFSVILKCFNLAKYYLRLRYFLDLLRTIISVMLNMFYYIIPFCRIIAEGSMLKCSYDQDF